MKSIPSTATTYPSSTIFQTFSSSTQSSKKSFDAPVTASGVPHQLIKDGTYVGFSSPPEQLFMQTNGPFTLYLDPETGKEAEVLKHTYTEGFNVCTTAAV